GMDDYVAKPIQREDLFRKISELSKTIVATESEPDDSAAEGPVHWPTALETTQGDESLLKEIAAVAVNEMPELLDEMRLAMEENDADGLRRSAHTLKSDLRIFGAAAAEHLAFHIENTARDGKTHVGETVGQLAAQLKGVQEDLRVFLELGAPTSSSDAEPSDAEPSDAEPSDAEPSDAEPSECVGETQL
ncbi:MAG: Hpt domain-containing protein, partial [Planctomycetales bacterium]